jgi:hypothetical protein
MKETIYDELSPELRKQIDAFVILQMQYVLIQRDDASLQAVREHAANLIISAFSILKSCDHATVKLYNIIRR